MHTHRAHVHADLDAGAAEQHVPAAICLSDHHLLAELVFEQLRVPRSLLHGVHQAQAPCQSARRLRKCGHAGLPSAQNL
eukprot:365910-Chlamydomonas_euryale.AAC.9